jgi:glyoxylase-like metal-dependent hydrolase (beta-lactamase superfamily II)
MSLLRRSIVAAALFEALAAPAPAQTLPFVLKQVGAGVYAAIDGPEHKAGSNAGFVIGDDGVLVVDAFFNLDAARALVAEIRRLTPKPIRYVVNTHYHVDHTGGDQALREAGAIIIAHRNVRGWVRVNNVNLLGDRITPEMKAQIQSLPLPDLTTDKDLTVWLGSRKVVVKTVFGHTGGDLTVAVPDAKVLFTGHVVAENPAQPDRRLGPGMDGDRRRFRAHAGRRAYELRPRSRRRRRPQGRGGLPLVPARPSAPGDPGQKGPAEGRGAVGLCEAEAACASPGLDHQRPRCGVRGPLHGRGAGRHEGPPDSAAGLNVSA